MKVNKRLYTCLKCKTLQEYISRLETSYEATRLYLRKGNDRVEEVNEQLKPTKFINIGQQDSK